MSSATDAHVGQVGSGAVGMSVADDHEEDHPFPGDTAAAKVSTAI